MAGLAGWERIYEGEGDECLGVGQEILREVLWVVVLLFLHESLFEWSSEVLGGWKASLGWVVSRL